MVKEIQKARDVNDYQLLASLNIPHIGVNMARQLLQEHTLEELRSMSAEEFAVLNGVGPERANALAEQFSLQKEYLDELLAAVTLKRTSSGQNEVKTVCFTGKMPEKRSYYEKLAVEKGYAAVDSVTSALTLLVAADPAASGGKLDKARKFGVKIVSLDEFLADESSENSTEDDTEELPLLSTISEEKAETSGSDEEFVNGELFSFDE